MKSKISVVIPVYKASSTIEKCAKSLFEQTMTEDVEFLFVNDCTPDNSIEILMSVVSRYPHLKEQIRILNNERNLGVSQARKRGIKEARGEYIAWVDSDDWIEPTMLEKMWEATRGGVVDVVVQNVVIDHYREEELTSSQEWKLYPANDCKDALMMYHTDRYVPWGLPFQMSKRTLLKDAVKRVYDVNITEDAMALIYLFANAKSCVWLENAYYHYISIEGSESLTSRNYKTKEEWSKQEKNVDAVTQYLLTINAEEYRTTANYIKWFWKNMFHSTFDNSWTFWRKYRECYRDAVKFDRTGIDTNLHKIKVWLKYNIYPIYWYKEGRFLSSNKNKR